jgi:hypothetical protein
MFGLSSLREREACFLGLSICQMVLESCGGLVFDPFLGEVALESRSVWNGHFLVCASFFGIWHFVDFNLICSSETLMQV